MDHLAAVKNVVSPLALAGAGLLGLTVPASAASMPSVTYSCSLAGYAQGLAPLSIPAALTAQSAAGTVTVTLTTQPAVLPTAAAAALPRFSYLRLAGTAPSNGMSATAVRLSGRTGPLGSGAASMTQLPAMTAVGTIPAGGGLTSVAFPPALTLTPVGAGSAAPLTCTTPTAVTVQVTAAGAPSAGTPPASGGFTSSGYTCTVTAGTSTTTASGVPMRLTTAAPATAGTPDTLMLSAPASTLGSAFPVSATPMAASGLASLGGAGGGMASGALTVPLTGLADTGNGMFRLTGPWTPRVPGMVRITAPRRFTARLREQTAVTVSVACTAATATTTTTRVMVQVAASASAAGMASEAAPAAAPGAPNTGAGGSLRPGSDLPLAAGGTAAFLAGLAIVLYTLRRRRGTAG